MIESNPLTPPNTGSLEASGNPLAPAAGPTMLTPAYDEKALLDLFDKLKRESTEQRYIFEREWLRDLYYVANRQWIYYHPTRREWVEKRLQQWVPRPVTNKMAEIVQSLRSNLAAINTIPTVRPAGHDTQSMAAAEIADQMIPLIYDEHRMHSGMRENDFWFIGTGNACIQMSWDRDKRTNRVFLPHEQCATCGQILPPQVIVKSGQMCPVCKGRQFKPALRPDMQPIGEWTAFGRGKTTPLSPFEWAFPPNVIRFDELPYIIRLRWRDKHYYEANFPEYVNRIVWEKSPADRSLQLFKSLSTSNDIGTGSQYSFLGSAGGHTVDGVTEYELWLKPTDEFPGGLVLRVAGDKNPILIQSQDEGLPGPFPYKDIDQRPIFPFAHAAYEHMGGRLYGRSALSPLIQKQDQLNQLDSLIQLIVQRMSNPVWVIPEGAGIDQFSGQPGWIMKWNPLAAGGQGKPERLAGESVPNGLFELRSQYLKDIEELSGAFDIIKGQKPTGVEAFSALQLLVERSQSRFGSAYSARGEMLRQWASVALELERQFGPEQRTRIVMGDHKGYTFRHFENAQLQGAITVHIEDGNQAQKTALGERAAIEQANTLRLINPEDPDQRYAILTKFGLSDLVPALDTHVQAALQMQDAFEMWAQQPVGQSPLVVKPWHDPMIHWSERIKWLNTDRMRELMASNVEIEKLITLHLGQLQMLIAPPVQIDPKTGEPIEQPAGQPGQAPPGGVGGGRAMGNSNANSTSTKIVPSGNRQSNQQQGPA